MIRYLPQQEKIRTKSMYQDNFPKDRQAFVEYYYKEKILDNQILVMEEEQKIQGMMHLNPYLFQLTDSQEILYYVVAVATGKQWQKQGKMKQLMEMALMDMEKKGLPFTFLIPANEKVYRSSGFSFVNVESFSNIKKLWNDEQKQTLVAAEIPMEITIEKVTMENVSYAVKFANTFLKKHYQVYPVVTKEMYERKIKELLADDGEILLFKNQQEIVGICSYGSEEGEVFIQDYMLDKELEEKGFFLLQDYFQEKKFVLQDMDYMVRILNLEKFCKFLRNDTLCTFRVKVLDSIISANNECFEICIGKDGGSLKTISKEKVEETITIAELASRLLKKRKIYIREWV